MRSPSSFARNAGRRAAQGRSIPDEMGVELRPEPGIEDGYRVIEVWDHRGGFETFMETRLAPAAAAIGLNRDMKVTTEPLFDIFAPKLAELPALVEDAVVRPNAPIPA